MYAQCEGAPNSCRGETGRDLFVGNENVGTIGEYTTSGATVKTALIATLDPDGLAISGSDLFVLNYYTNTVGEYTTNGATVKASLISGLDGPSGIAIGPESPPTFTGINTSNSTLNVTGMNCPGGGTYILLQSTNLALPMAQWTPVLTNRFNSDGTLSLSTNIVNLANHAEFYTLKVSE